MKNKKNRGRFGIKSLFALAFLAYFCYVLFSQQSMLSQYRKQRAALSRQITQCRQQQLRYEEMRALYESPDFIEQVARERLGFVFPDEKIFVDGP